MSTAFSASALSPALAQLLKELRGPDVWIEVLALLTCITLAWVVARTLARHFATGAKAPAGSDDAAPPTRAQDSVWFGRRVLDGLLFPLLVLVLVYAARRLLGGVMPGVALLSVAVPVSLSLVLVRFVARVLTSVFPASAGVRLIERGVSWLVWLGMVLWLVGALPVLLDELDAVKFTMGKSTLTLRSLLETCLLFGLSLVLTLWISKLVETRLLDKAISDLSMRKAATNAVRVILLTVGLLLALSIAGVDLTALSVLGGALGVGLGLGLQKLAANYVSGFVILLERSLRIGDTVRIDTFEGRISDIKTRYTIIRAPNGRESVVPNEKLLTERVENLSLADPNISLQTVIQVGYDSDVAQVQALLCGAARAHPRVLADPEPNAMLTNFAADGLEFTLVFWIRDPSNAQTGVRSDVNIAVLQALRAANIDIPYPQRVLHVQPAPVAAAPTSAGPSVGPVAL